MSAHRIAPNSTAFINADANCIRGPSCRSALLGQHRQEPRRRTSPCRWPIALSLPDRVERSAPIDFVVQSKCDIQRLQWRRILASNRPQSSSSVDMFIHHGDFDADAWPAWVGCRQTRLTAPTTIIDCRGISFDRVAIQCFVTNRAITCRVSTASGIWFPHCVHTVSRLEYDFYSRVAA